MDLIFTQKYLPPNISTYEPQVSKYTSLIRRGIKWQRFNQTRIYESVPSFMWGSEPRSCGQAHQNKMAILGCMDSTTYLTVTLVVTYLSLHATRLWVFYWMPPYFRHFDISFIPNILTPSEAHGRCIIKYVLYSMYGTDSVESPQNIRLFLTVFNYAFWTR